MTSLNYLSVRRGCKPVAFPNSPLDEPLNLSLARRSPKAEMTPPETPQTPQTPYSPSAVNYKKSLLKRFYGEY